MVTSDRILGLVGTAMIVAAVVLLVVGGPADDGSSVLPPPTLELLRPADGQAVALPLEVVFRSGVSLGRGPGGWGSDGYHIHASVNGRELMPGPEDIVRSEDGTYTWRIAGVPDGQVALRLFWSDSRHVPISGQSQTGINILVGSAEP